MREGRVFQNVDPRHFGTGPNGPIIPAGTPRAWLTLVGLVGLCLLTGAVGGLITAPAMRTWYAALQRPPGTPPDWVFAPVWTALYVMMGIAAWLIWRRGRREALQVWGWQLLVNAIWPPLFFAVRSPGMALIVIAALLLLVTLTAYMFARIDTRAGVLMMPYVGWVAFATYLNAGFWWLNGG